VQYQSGRSAQIVLLIVYAVSEFSQQIIELEKADADALIKIYVKAAAKRRSEGVLRRFPIGTKKSRSTGRGYLFTRQTSCAE
jgi:hypothetical protein